MSAILIQDGVRFVNASVMMAACSHPHFTTNAALMLKVGVEKGDPISSVLAHVLGNFVLDISGQSAGVKLSAEEAAQMEKQLAQKAEPTHSIEVAQALQDDFLACLQSLIAGAPAESRRAVRDAMFSLCVALDGMNARYGPYPLYALNHAASTDPKAPSPQVEISGWAAGRELHDQAAKVLKAAAS